jgi:branched-chain amino acid transport system substrate-binding protein
MWDIKVPTLNGEVAFAKSGPSGKESGQSVPQVHFVKIVQGKVQLLR